MISKTGRGGRRQKAGTILQVSDGAGGFRQIIDRRFEITDWPIHLIVAASRSQDWLSHFAAECEVRNWSSSEISQLDAAENSGSRTVSGQTPGAAPIIECTWERPRNGGLVVALRPSQGGGLSEEDLRAFVADVESRSINKVKVTAHRRGYLSFEGLPWRGELWLNDSLCLSPPVQHAPFLAAPQVVLVNSMASGIGALGVNASFDQEMRHLAIFLTVVLGQYFHLQSFHKAWAIEYAQDGKFVRCHLANLGYVEPHGTLAMPISGGYPSVPIQTISRPDLEIRAIRSRDTELSVPEDIHELYAHFRSLDEPERVQFLSAGNALCISKSLWPSQQTASVAFLVVACEALKPRRKGAKNMDAFAIVGALIGQKAVAALRALPLQPFKIRGEHFHKGTLHADELLPSMLMAPFGDPSFSYTSYMLSTVAHACIIEWLRNGGRIARTI